MQIWASNNREEYVARKHKLHDSKNCHITEKYDWFQSSQISSFRIQNAEGFQILWQQQGFIAGTIKLSWNWELWIGFRALRFELWDPKMQLKSHQQVSDSMAIAGPYCPKIVIKLRTVDWFQSSGFKLQDPKMCLKISWARRFHILRQQQGLLSWLRFTNNSAFRNIPNEDHKWQ